MRDWMDFDIDQTIRDFDYTLRAAQKMESVIVSEDFEDMNAEMIFQYLSKEMEIVLFGDFLKRYVYRIAEIDAPFSEIPNDTYLEIMIDSFVDNSAPHSFTKTSKKRRAAIKAWLDQDSVKRDTIFLLGFGLRMPVQDVSEFLVKVQKEADFDFTNAREVIFWYCFKRGLPYANAMKLLRDYESLTPVEMSEKKWVAMTDALEMYLLTEENLLTYLSALKARQEYEKKMEAVFNVFTDLYNQCRSIIAQLYNDDLVSEEPKKVWTMEDIQPGDLEKILYSGIPVSKSGNLKKMSASKLASVFKHKRMDRQRIHAVLEKKKVAERFDLITLLFFIFAETVEPDWPNERYLQYVDEINRILEECSMMGIYPVNPYEAFVLMCIVTEDPMDVFAEIWEKSFEE